MMRLTDEQRGLLADKYVLWDKAAREGSMDTRDYNRRAADALKVALSLAADEGLRLTAFAWLIEAPGQNYLSALTIGHQTRFFWRRDSTLATRFFSKEQADLVMMAVRALEPDLWAFARAGLGEAWPVEHGWVSLPQRPRRADNDPIP